MKLSCVIYFLQQQKKNTRKKICWKNTKLIAERFKKMDWSYQ